jgi:hypothetical protein
LERACREELAQAYRNLDLAWARVKATEHEEWTAKKDEPQIAAIIQAAQAKKEHDLRAASRGPQGTIDAMRDVRALKQAAVLSTVR